MSRRSRRRGTSDGQSWLGKTALGLVVVGVLGAVILYAMVRGYLYSDSFRRFLSDHVSKAAGVDGEFTPFQWDGLAVDTAAFEATGKGIIKGLRMDGLHTEVGVGGLRRGVWEIRESRLQRLEITIDVRNNPVAATLPVEQQPVAPQVKKPGWLPREIELQGMDLREVMVQAMLNQGPASISGMRLRVEPVSGRRVYRVDATGATIRLPFSQLPEIRLDRARLRYQDGQVFLNSATAAAWKDGHLAASGEWDSTAQRYALTGDISGVKCEDLFNADWAKRCIGDLSSDFTLDNNAGAPAARGHLTARNATLTALPVLDALAAYADTRRFRVLALSEAHADWRWQNGEVNLTNMVLASEGLARLEGSLTIRDRMLDGRFRLGLAPGTLASIPGAETDVFAMGERGLVWASLRITGSLDDPKEDLTDRLVARRACACLTSFPKPVSASLNTPAHCLVNRLPRRSKKG